MTTGHVRHDDDSVLRRLRAFCLSLPETSEVGSWGHPNFRAGRKTFAAFEWIAKRPSIAIRLDPVDVDLLLRRKDFFATPYGRGQWVSLWSDRRLNWSLVERLLRRSYLLVASKPMIAALEDGARERPADRALQPTSRAKRKAKSKRR